MDERTARRSIVEAGKRLADRFFVAANDGNISCRIAANEFLITPTGVNKGDVTEEAILKVDSAGRVLSGSLKPTSEMKMHLAVYRARPDVKAVLHAHPPAATGFAACRVRLDRDVFLPEVIFGLGRIGLAQYGTPTTDEVPRAVEKEISGCDALLLANHGALTVGEDPMQAYWRMETVEMYARVRLVTGMLGGAAQLSPGQTEALFQVRESQGWGGKRADAAAAAGNPVDERMVSLIAQAVADALEGGR
jgi:L-fuculose-phosphate aldolase